MGVKLVSASGGSVEINPPATASNFVATMPAGAGTVAVNGVSGTLVSGTAVASTSGTSIDFTGIPSWVKRITVMFNGVSTNGTSSPMIQIGTSGGVQTSGYACTASSINAGTAGVSAYTTGFTVRSGNAATALIGFLTLSLVDSATGTWSCSGTLGDTGTTSTYTLGGIRVLSGTLDRVRITTVNGTDTFDAGSINILYE